MKDTIKKLYIEASSRCNLACKMCFRHSWIDESFGDLDPAVFTRLLEDPELVPTETIFFGGMGEPMVHPDIIDMVAQASAHGKKVELITNGTLLDQRRCEALLAAGLTRLWVSIDDIYENYAKIQRGGSFGKVVGHLEKFNELRKETDVRLGVTTVIMRDNLSSLAKVKKFAEQLGADDMNFSHMIPNREEDESQTLWYACKNTVLRTENVGSYFTVDSPLPDPRQGIPMFSFYDRMKPELFPDGSDPEETGLFSWKGETVMRRANYCRFIEEGQCFVRWDGDVAPCMGLLHSSATYLQEKRRVVWRHSYGNLSDQSISEIWNSKEYSEFRDRVRAFSFSPCLTCGGCENRLENRIDCIGNEDPVCGACLWGQGFISCP